MSKFNKSAVALAIVAALSLPTVVAAAEAGYVNDVDAYARNLFPNTTAGNGNVIVSPEDFSITLQTSDNLIGRTTGFGIRFKLGNSARFTATQPNLVAGADLPAGWIVGGGTLNTARTEVVYAVTADPNDGLVVGEMLSIAAGDIELTNLGVALGVAGGSVPVTIELFDSNTAVVLLTLNATLATSVEGVKVAINSGNGDVGKRIDVATCTNSNPVVASKRRFAPAPGTVGGSCNADDDDRLLFNAGEITIGVQGIADGFAGNNNSGNPGAGNFQFVAANDKITVTATGTNLSAFDNATGDDRFFLSSSPDCLNPVAPDGTTQRVATGGASAAVRVTAANFGGATGGTRYACFEVDAVKLPMLVQQNLTATVAVDIAATNVIDPANAVGDLLPLLFNGTVLEFQNVNPAANATAQSFLRFTNNGNIDCPVTMTARDDNGVAGASTISFTLAKSKSIQITSDDIEGGNAAKGLTGSFGDGAGKWYVTADGECAGLVGSALNRNNTDGTVTNLTPQNHGN